MDVSGLLEIGGKNDLAKVRIKINVIPHIPARTHEHTQKKRVTIKQIYMMSNTHTGRIRAIFPLCLIIVALVLSLFHCSIFIISAERTNTRVASTKQRFVFLEMFHFFGKYWNIYIYTNMEYLTFMNTHTHIRLRQNVKIKSSSPLNDDDGEHLLWAKRAGGPGIDRGYGIAVDREDSTIVTGRFSDKATFGEGNSQVILSSTGRWNLFVAKYDRQGDLIWARKDGNFTEDALAAATDGKGDVYVTGHFTHNSIFFGENGSEVKLISKGRDDIFIAKYVAATGKLIWVQRAGGEDVDQAVDIAIDPDGNAIVTGFFQKKATFGEGQSMVEIEATGSHDSFIAKYSPSGALIWVKHARAIFLDEATAVATDDDGNIVVSGHFMGTIEFGEEDNEVVLIGTSATDVYVTKYNSSGRLVWAKHVKGTKEKKSAAIAVDKHGNSIVTGHFEGTILLGEGDSTVSLTSVGPWSMFIAKYTSDGDLLWAQMASGEASVVHGKGIASDADGNSVMTGHFRGVITFGGDVKLVNPGESFEVFVAMYTPDGDLLWAKKTGGKSPHSGTSIALDGNGSSVVTGLFDGVVTFGEGSNLAMLESAGLSDVFIVKYGCQAGAARSNNRCLKCSAGHFQDEPGMISCKPCPMGHHQDETGKVSCKKCQDGYHQGNTGQPSCDACPAGRESNSDHTQCVRCSQGWISPSAGTMCRPCPAGQEPNSGQTVCSQCLRGSFNPSEGSLCQKCDAGHFQDKTGQQTCDKCPPGHYQNESGQSVCWPCPLNQIAPQEGSIRCEQCSEGKAASEDKTRCVKESSFLVGTGGLIAGLSIASVSAIAVCIAATVGIVWYFKRSKKTTHDQLAKQGFSQLSDELEEEEFEGGEDTGAQVNIEMVDRKSSPRQKRRKSKKKKH